MHVFKHPKYYTELRKRNRDLPELQQVKLERSVPQSDQVISSDTATAASERAPDPGPKPQATSYKLPGPRPISNANKGLLHKHQATSNKRQAPSSEKNKPQASSPKQQASSSKPQASSSKILEPR